MIKFKKNLRGTEAPLFQDCASHSSSLLMLISPNIYSWWEIWLYRWTNKQTPTIIETDIVLVLELCSDIWNNYRNPTLIDDLGHYKVLKLHRDIQCRSKTLQQVNYYLLRRELPAKFLNCILWSFLVLIYMDNTNNFSNISLPLKV